MTMRFWILAALSGLAAAVSPAAAPARKTAPKDVTAKTLVFFDNDFLGPGQSNIQALIPLLRNPDVDVIGLGVVTGDQWATEATAHALRFLEIAKRTDVPVHTGASMPLIRDQAEMKAWETRFGNIPFKGAWNAPRPGRTYHPDAPDLIPPMPEGAPKKAIEALGESGSQNDVRGDFAHHIDLKPLLAACKTILRHNLQHAVGLVGRAAEGDHYHDVSEAHLLSQTPDCAAF